MKRQFPVTVGVFVASFSAPGCGVRDSEISDRGWWTGDASVSSDASSPSDNTDAAVAADGGGQSYGNDASVVDPEPGEEGEGGRGGAAGGEPQGSGGAGGEDQAA